MKGKYNIRALWVNTKWFFNRLNHSVDRTGRGLEWFFTGYYPSH